MNTICLQKFNNTQLAKSLSVTSQCVSQWFSGKRQPSIDMLPKLAKALNCSIDELVYALIATKENPPATKKQTSI